MDPLIARALTTDAGDAALAVAGDMADPDSLAAAERMRRQFPAELSAAALTQIGLRRRARVKVGARADSMLWTPDGVEQATRGEVSAWRARRMTDAGVTRVVDIGCGCGADALAFIDAGLAVSAVEIDEATAILARFNLARAAQAAGASVEVICGDGVELVDELTRAPDRVDGSVGDRPCVFLDPARRNARGRSWRVADLRPSWQFVAGQLSAGHACCVKLGPGFPTELLPDDVQALWVSESGDLVECSLWHLPGAGQAAMQLTGAPGSGWIPGRGAVLLPQQTMVSAEPGSAELPVAAPGRYLYEPDPAVSRSGVVAAIAAAPPISGEPPSGEPASRSSGGRLWRLAPGVGYLSSDELLNTDLARAFEVVEELDPDVSSLRRWVHEHRIGTLEIKKRAVDIDPAALRRRLRPKGGKSATLVITPTISGVRALHVERVPRSWVVG